MSESTESSRPDAHQRYAALLEQIAVDAPLPETLDALTRYVEDELPGAIASLLLLDDGVHLRSAAGPHLPPAYSAAIDGIAIGPSVGSCGTAAYAGVPVMVEDIDVDPRWAAFRALAGTGRRATRGDLGDAQGAAQAHQGRPRHGSFEEELASLANASPLRRWGSQLRIQR